MVIFSTLAAGAMAALCALESSALPAPTYSTSNGAAHQSLLGRGVRYALKDNGSKKSGTEFAKTKRGTSDLVEAADLRRSDHEHIHIDSHHRHHHNDHEHIHVHKREPHHHYHHGDEHEHVHVHKRDHHHHHHHHQDEHEHIHIHERDHRHHHHHHHHDSHKRDYAPSRNVLVHSHDDHPILLLDVYARVQGLHSRALLDPLADALAPLGPLLGTLVLVLTGLPIVGGVMSIVSSTAAGIGGAKIGTLLTGKPVSTAAFVTNDMAGSPVQSLAYQIDASDSTPTSMFLAKLPYVFAPTACSNDSSVPVSLAIPVMGNSSLQIMCATYNSAPAAPSILTAQPCWNATEGTQPANMSQVFAWNADSGVVHPLWNATALSPSSSSEDGNCSTSSQTSYSAITTGSSNNSTDSPQVVNLVFSASPSTLATYAGDVPDPSSNDTTTADPLSTTSPATSPTNDDGSTDDASDDGTDDGTDDSDSTATTPVATPVPQ